MQPVNIFISLNRPTDTKALHLGQGSILRHCSNRVQIRLPTRAILLRLLNFQNGERLIIISHSVASRTEFFKITACSFSFI